MLEVVLVDVLHGRSPVLAAVETVLWVRFVMGEQRGFLAVSVGRRERKRL